MPGNRLRWGNIVCFGLAVLFSFFFLVLFYFPTKKLASGKWRLLCLRREFTKVKWVRVLKMVLWYWIFKLKNKTLFDKNRLTDLSQSTVAKILDPCIRVNYGTLLTLQSSNINLAKICILLWAHRYTEELPELPMGPNLRQGEKAGIPSFLLGNSEMSSIHYNL